MTTAAAPARPLLALTAGPAAASRPHPEPAAAPAVAPAEQRTRAIVPPLTPGIRGEETRRLGGRSRTASPSQILAWLAASPAAIRAEGWPGDAAGVEPVSVTVTALTCDAHIAVATPDAFRAWCGYLRVKPRAIRRETCLLGVLAQGTTTVDGWALHVRLFGAPAEELF